MAYPDHNVLYRWNGETRLANPFSHLHNWASVHENAVTSRPASSQNMTDVYEAEITDFVDELADNGYKPNEIDSIVETLGVTKQELATIRQGEQAGTLTYDAAYRRTRVAAATMDAITHRHGVANDPSILGASEAELRRWFEFDYPAAILSTLENLEEIEVNDSSGNLSENENWALLEAQLRRRCGLAWECAKRLNANAFNGQLKLVNLQPLDEHEAASATD